MATAEPPTEPTRRKDAATPPKVSPGFAWCFHTYLPKFVRKNFHAVGLLKRGGCPCPDVPAEGPLIVVLNHPSWWDPLMGLLLAKHCFPDRQFRAPIDAAMLAKYRVFAMLGFYGVDQSSAAGARDFLRTSRAICAAEGESIWLTPEGRFADVRDDAELEPGAGHLLSKLGRGTLLPLAAEYPFWEEKRPEALAAFGDPVSIADHAGLSKAAWTELVRARLRQTQAELTAASVARDPAAFEVVLSGEAGVGGFYDLGRRLKSWAGLRRFRPEHGAKFNR